MRHVTANANATARSQTRLMATLPRLPVPDLHKTIERYIASLEPFMLEDERLGKASYESSYALRLKRAKAFEFGIGQVLQERLIALDKVSPNNWLDDNFWIYKAYLEWRAPLLINSNWWLAFHDDNMIPGSAATGESDSGAGITPWQIKRAAWLVYRTLEFRGRLDSQELHPETTRTGIWLRESTAKMFNIARIPAIQCDFLSSPLDFSSPDSLKLLLMTHNWCYSISVYHPSNAGYTVPQLMEPREIESQIRAVVSDVEQRLANGESAIPIGTLSADQRDRWAENQKHLLSISPRNQKVYNTLVNSVMGLSLDHATHSLPPSPRKSYDPQSMTQQTLDSHLHTIRAHPLNFSNRFYDKPFTLIVDPATRAGATGEHSSCDALVPSIVAEYAIVEGVDESAFSENPDEHVGGWERLDWVADDHIERECAGARTRALSHIEDSDDSVLWFEGYGTDWIKGVAKLSPDPYVQMALQLAWYKTRNEFTATYETVLTRMFKHGRTETLRTLTRDSRTWVLTMVDPEATPTMRYLALRQAVAKHSRLTKEAATGRGIDRHLLGLKLMLRPQDDERSALLEDELFERSQRWKLSTSGLSAGHLFRGTGFGAMYDDGYGINYLAAPDMIKFGIESKFRSPSTSTDGFKQAIVDSLYEMRTTCSSDIVAPLDLTSHL